MKTIVRIFILVSLAALSACVVVPAQQQGYSSYLEGNGGGYSSGAYITPPPVYIAPYYGGYYNYGYRRNWGWGANRRNYRGYRGGYYRRW